MVTTKDWLQELNKQTEKHLQKAISEWQLLSPEQMAKRPAPDRWSAAQCLEHLNIYGRYYIPAMEAAITKAHLSGSSPATHFKSGWLGKYFTNMMHPKRDAQGRIKNKMSAPKNAVPSDDPDPREMLAEFIAQKEQIIGLLAKAQQVDIGRIRVPISIARWIRLRLGDVLMFVTVHDQRHIQQAEQAIGQG